jgi:uncharacterized SAM-binding protein YcdF (DUF218 family)
MRSIPAGREGTGRRVARRVRTFVLVTLLLALPWAFADTLLTAMGRLVVDVRIPTRADAAVVLAGPTYWARLQEAARLYRAGIVDVLVIDGGRKDDTLRQLEAAGFAPACPWYQDSLTALEMMGVPATDVVAIDASEAYDTVSEALWVGAAIERLGLRELIITTSQYHTRRSGLIWRAVSAGRFTIYTAGASGDGYTPNGWWRDGRQVRWLLAEYGGFLYYGWKRATGEWD